MVVVNERYSAGCQQRKGRQDGNLGGELSLIPAAAAAGSRERRVDGRAGVQVVGTLGRSGPLGSWVQREPCGQ